MLGLIHHMRFQSWFSKQSARSVMSPTQNHGYDHGGHFIQCTGAFCTSNRNSRCFVQRCRFTGVCTVTFGTA